MNIQAIKQNRFVRNFYKDKWLILFSILIVMVWAGIYLLFFYQPTYKSEAKVWIKDVATESYVVHGGEPRSQMRALTSAGNPILTQMEILKSKEMEQYLASLIRNKENFKMLKKVGKQGATQNSSVVTRDILEARTEPGTDIIKIELKWHDPVMAKELLVAALEKFDAVNLGINRDIQTKKRTYVDERLLEIEQKLLTVRDQIKQYKLGTMAVDLDEQTREMVRLKSQFVSRMEDVIASRQNAQGKVSSLQNQLSMTSKEAIRAVALGSGNENLVKLRNTINELKQQYAHDAIKLAPTNPKMVALKSKIETLENQIQDEIRQTVGMGGAAKSVHIYDPVREGLVEELSTTQARLRGLDSEIASLQESIARIDSTMKNIPESKYMLDNLQQEERTLALAYDELRKKQIEARIKEAETPSNVFVVDPPRVPESQSFPTPLHILLLSPMLGLVAGLGLSGLRTYSEDVCEGDIAVEQVTRAHVLGVIPWMRRPVSFQTSDPNVLSINDIAYKHILSNLKLHSAREGAHVITFSSTSLQRSRVSTVYTLASRLSKQGDSVALIDADFRTVNVYKKYPFAEADMMDLSDLIDEVDRKLRFSQEVYVNEIISALRPDRNGIHLGVNKKEMPHAYDSFSSKGFLHILNVLREHFDWVFIDSPSAAIAPEFVQVAHLSDGVVLFADKRVTNAVMKRVIKKIQITGAPLLGTVIREESPEMEREHREYTDWANRWDRGQTLPVNAAASVPMQSSRVDFMGAKIDALTMEQTLDRVAEIIDNREQVQHVVINVAKLVYMQNDPSLKRIINECGLINADGAGIVLGAKIMGIPIPERVAGIDLMQNLVHLANDHHYRLYFLGAEPEVLERVVDIYRQQYPNLEICGYRDGYFNPSEEMNIAKEIRDAQPDILFVAMSSPKKEKFIKEYKDMMGVPFVMGVGGSLDVIAGKVKRAPGWVQDFGMEWAYRILQEPRRMWKRYLVTNTQYGLMLVNNMISSRLRPRSTYG